MTEIAKVKTLQGNRVVLACGDAAGCKTCAGKGFCSVQERTYEALVDEGVAVELGDTVEVHLPSGQTVFSAFLVMIVPLLLFMAGFMASRRLLGLEGEGIPTLFGLAGLGLGFLLSFIYSRSRSQGSKGMPRVTRRLSSESP